MDKKMQCFFIGIMIVFLIHDLEEIYTVEAFLQKSSLPFSVTTGEFALAFSLLFLIVIISFLVVRSGRTFLSLSAERLLFVIVVLLGVNALTHLLQMLILRSYVPGVITSATLVLPFCLRYFRIFPTGGAGRLGKMGAIAFGLQAVLAVSALLISKLLI